MSEGCGGQNRIGDGLRLCNEQLLTDYATTVLGFKFSTQ